MVLLPLERAEGPTLDTHQSSHETAGDCGRQDIHRFWPPSHSLAAGGRTWTPIDLDVSRWVSTLRPAGCPRSAGLQDQPGWWVSNISRQPQFDGCPPSDRRNIPPIPRVDLSVTRAGEHNESYCPCRASRASGL